MPPKPEPPSGPRPSLSALAKQAGLDAPSGEHAAAHVTEVDHTDRDGHRWRCRVGFAVLAGQLQPVSFEIGSADNGQRRITTALMRSLPVATIEEQARQQLLHHADVRLAFEHALTGPIGSPGVDEARRQRRKLRGPDSIFLRYVAALHTQATAAGDRAPAKVIARAVSEMRGQTVTPVAARNWIRRCRQLGMLPPAAAARP